jgi:uroporphyrinogen decarboxylase
MKSRERTLTAIDLKEPDRVPIFADMVPELEDKFFHKYGLSGNKLLTFLGNDLVVEAVGVANSYAKINEGETRDDEWGIGWKAAKHNKGTYTEISSRPLENASYKDLKEYKIPDPEDDKRYEAVYKLKEDFSDEYAVMIDLSCTIFEISWYLRGMDKLLMDMVVDSRFVNDLMDKVLEFYIPAAKKLAKIGVDIIWTGDDVGMQTGMMLSPEMFNTYLKERYRIFINEIKRTNDKVKIAFHSDGSIVPIIDDLIEIGVDILNPVQPKCMDPKKIKDNFGSKLCFMGTIDEQDILPFGTLEDLRIEIDERIETVGKGGGLILGPTHNIQNDTEMEKVEFMFDYIKEKGIYLED